MKKNYEKPIIEIIEIDNEDIITTSGAPMTVEKALFGGRGGTNLG